MLPFFTKKDIINLAVKKLKKFGFTKVTPSNIMEDDVYRHYFEKILKENLNRELTTDLIIRELLNELASLTPKPKGISGYASNEG